MKLYHYTIPERLFCIATGGLEPGLGRDDQNFHMTMGKPVVWLTQEESNQTTAAVLAHWAKYMKPDREVGDPMYGGPVRLTVNIPRHDKRLIHYRKWVHKHRDDVELDENGTAHANDAGEFLTIGHRLDILTPLALAHWWMYRGTIAPHKIEITAALTLQAVDAQLAHATDEDFIAHLHTMRDQAAASPPDQLCSFSLV